MVILTDRWQKMGNKIRADGVKTVSSSIYLRVFELIVILRLFHHLFQN